MPWAGCRDTAAAVAGAVIPLAITAAAADRLRDDGRRLLSASGQCAARVNFRLIGISAITAPATERESNAILVASSITLGPSAITTATTNRLSQNSRRNHTVSRN